METFRDFLIWYNNLDVVPFLEAIDKMSAFWKERNIDIFKDGVSVPGLTMKYLFSNVPNVYFSLFTEKDKDLYYTMKDNNVGGPSIIFNRYHEKDKTNVRKDENLNHAKKWLATTRMRFTFGQSCRICQRDNIHDWKATTLRDSGVVKWR